MEVAVVILGLHRLRKPEMVPVEAGLLEEVLPLRGAEAEILRLAEGAVGEVELQFVPEEDQLVTQGQIQMG